jgi:hypothetical protein
MTQELAAFNAEAEATEILRYLWKCRNEAERLDLLVASLRLIEQKGAWRGFRDAAAGVGVALDSNRATNH